MIQTPTPFDESSIKDRFWTPEPWDVNLPSPGFLTDFVLALRGIETPTKFTLWTGLFILSTVIKRDVWLSWYPKPFFANLYVFLVAPPAICPKSTPMEWADGALLTSYHKLIEDPVLRRLKEINISRTRVTPESIFKLLKPRSESIRVGDHFEKVRIGSNGCFFVDELSTFFGKQQYNVGLIDCFTNLYTCKKIEDSFTLIRDKEILEDVYVTFLGGTQPETLTELLPENSFGSGFMSRVIIVCQETPTRVFPIPEKPPEGFPTEDQLRERLAWVAENARGEHILDEQAKQWYNEWYHDFRKRLVENMSHQNRRLSRFKIHLLQLALLLRVQRYEPGNIIGLTEMLQAKKILDDALASSNRIAGQVKNDPIQQATSVLRDYLQKKTPVKRRKLLSAHSYRYKVSDINAALRELKELDLIHIRCGGTCTSFISSSGDEIYEWNGGDD